MKNMVLLIDANVFINYLTNRTPGFSGAKQIISYCQEEKLDGYMAFHTISILWYVLRKISQEDRRSMLLHLCEVITVIGASHKDVLDAIKNVRFPDFEDCLQEKCAESIDADYIVTENISDYNNSSIPAITPANLFRIISRQS